jgi:hypothetical protein
MANAEFPAGRPALGIPHSAFRIPHSAFGVPHSAFRIPHSAFGIPHSAFRIPHSAIALGVTILLLALTLPGRALAADALHLSIEPATVGVGDDVTATVSAESKTAGQPHLNGIDGFDVVGTVSQSSVQFINSQFSISRQTVFTLRARRAGRYTIVAEAGGARSSPVTVVVGAGGGPAAPPPPPPSVPPPASGRGGGAGRPFFVQAVARPTNPVVGRQVIVEYYLHIREGVQAEKYELAGVPEFVGFTQTELPTSPKLVFAQESIGGVPYQTALVKRFAVFPTAAGDQTIGPMEMRIHYLKRDRSSRSMDPFGMFPSLLRERDVAEVESEPLTLNVQQLPAAGQPPDFAGAVGRLDIKDEVDRANVPTGEPFTLKVTIEGEGDVETVHRPKLELSPNLHVYSDKDRSEVTPGFDKVTGKKFFETILIATAPGDYQIPPLRLPYYDPEAREYKVATTAAIAVRASGDAGAAASHSLGVMSREAVELRGRDLRYIHRDKPALRRKQTPLVASTLVWIALGLWPLLAAGVVVYQVRQGRQRADRRTYRSRRAFKEAQLRLRAARQAIDGADPTPFYAELHRAVIGFIADKLDAAAPGLDRADLLRSLAGKGVRPEALENLDALWKAADAVRFGGAVADHAARREALDDANRLLAALGEGLSL